MHPQIKVSPWKAHVSADFLKHATDSLHNSKSCAEKVGIGARKIRGELYAIELRANRVREWHNAIFAAARGLASTRHAMPWAECVSGPLEQLWRDAELRLKRWAK